MTYSPGRALFFDSEQGDAEYAGAHRKSRSSVVGGHRRQSNVGKSVLFTRLTGHYATASKLLTPVQLVVACVALTLFLPCIAQLLINVKERGWKVGVAISGIVLVLSFGVAFVLNIAQLGLGVTL